MAKAPTKVACRIMATTHVTTKPRTTPITWDRRPGERRFVVDGVRTGVTDVFDDQARAACLVRCIAVGVATRLVACTVLLLGAHPRTSGTGLKPGHWLSDERA